MLQRNESIFSGEKIKQCRKEKGYTRKQLSELTGNLYSVETIHKWESGRVPLRLAPLIILADALECSIKDFVKPGKNLRLKAEHLPVNLEELKKEEWALISRRNKKNNQNEE